MVVISVLDPAPAGWHCMLVPHTQSRLLNPWAPAHFDQEPSCRPWGRGGSSKQPHWAFLPQAFTVWAWRAVRWDDVLALGAPRAADSAADQKDLSGLQVAAEASRVVMVAPCWPEARVP